MLPCCVLRAPRYGIVLCVIIVVVEEPRVLSFLTLAANRRQPVRTIDSLRTMCLRVF